MFSAHQPKELKCKDHKKLNKESPSLSKKPSPSHKKHSKKSRKVTPKQSK